MWLYVFHPLNTKKEAFKDTELPELFSPASISAEDINNPAPWGDRGAVLVGATHASVTPTLPWQVFRAFQGTQIVQKLLLADIFC